MRRFLAVTLLGVLMSATPAFADDQSGSVPSITTAAALAAATTADAEAAQFLRRYQRSSQRPMMLPALYGMSAALQGYDAYSTLTVLKHGGVEANPVMKGITKNPMAFIGLKAGVTAMSIMAAERMWKNNNRVGAIVTMVVTNGLMTAVAANNAKVLSRVR
jgi:hypothetical protein